VRAHPFPSGAEPALSALFFSTGFLAFLECLSNFRKPRDGFGYVPFRGLHNLLGGVSLHNIDDLFDSLVDVFGLS
jgi:hypothetical protein